MSEQTYRGNGEHTWECVIEGHELLALGDTYIIENVSRLRVPGGWLYRTDRTHYDNDTEHSYTETVTFVPMPEVVKHKV